MTQPARPLIFGEVLFDHFEDGQRVLGGAPFNVAWHLQAMGLAPLFISRIGDDEQGQQILQAMAQWGMDSSALQQDTRHPTGVVQVTIANNEPSYEIVTNRAYDFISADELPEVEQCGLLYHGSLALRNSVSLDALDRLKSNFNGLIFMDINLREPWWQRDQIFVWLKDAHWVKLNHDELQQLGFGKGSMLDEAQRFIKQFDLQGVVLTCGADGAYAMSADADVVQVAPQPALQVVDTVGAGDAFASVVIAGLIRGWPLQQTLERAQRFASRIVTMRGAVPDGDEFYSDLNVDQA